MSKKILVNLDLNKNQLQNAVIDNQAVDPAGAVQGQVYFDTDDKRIKMHTGSAFKKLITEDDAGSATMAGLTDTIITAPAAGNLVIYDGTDTWDNKAVSGDIALAADGTTTIQAWAVDFAMLASGDITTDLGASATTTEIARADAVKAYVDAAVATADAFTVQGWLDCSTNPNYPAANAGDSYRVTVSGKIGWVSGVIVEVWDLIICFTDATASGDHATVGAEWIVEQTNLEAASETVAGYVELATDAEVNSGSDTARAITPAGLNQRTASNTQTGLVELATDAETATGTDTNRAVTPANLASMAYINKYTWTIWDTTTTAIAVTHGLGTQYVTAQAFDDTTGDIVECEIQLTNATTTTFTFAVAPGTDEIRVVCTG